MNFDPQAVGHKAHHAGRFDPWNLFQLRLLLGKGNKENVSANVGAHHFHDLRLGDVFHSGDFDVVAGLDAETPGALAVVIEHPAAPIARTHRTVTATKAHSRRFAVFLGSGPRRAGTRFCARRNGDSSSTSRSTRRASSSSSRAGGALGGYNSSCMMVEPLFRAINSGSCREESLSFFTIASFLDLR